MTDATRTGAEPAEVTGTFAGIAVGDARPLASGYTLGEEIGRGGMGVVFRAHDLGLDREVAVKLLQDKYAPGSGTATRFVEEARITGQLQHPGIPAVYHVGTWTDGRPFLAMKLIKGRTLDDLLKGDGPGPTRWLGVFEGICHAVGYAHARNVIHRDLKPQNVMVGAFGEVQVMDWGLAKVLTPGAKAATTITAKEETLAASEIRSLRDSDGSFTQAGSVLGTPAYMPPEQAAGELDKIDQRADVFSLGATLCEILTGQPPYGRGASGIVLFRALKGMLNPALEELDRCGSDPELISLCKRCMAFETADRPANADMVAREVARLRTAADDRARTAELDRAKAEVQAAEQRKRRRVLAWSGAAVIAVLAAGVVASVLQTNRARDAEAAVSAQLVKTQKAEAAARAKSDEMDATLKLISYATVREGQEQQAVEFYQRLVVIRQRAVDEDPTNLPKRLELADGLQNLANTYQRLEQYAQAADVTTKELAVRQSQVSVEPNNVDYQMRLGRTYSYLGILRASLKDYEAARDHHQRASEIHGRIAAAHPTDLGYQWDYYNCCRSFAVALDNLGQTRQAREQYLLSLASIKKIEELNPRDDSTVYQVGITYQDLGVITRKLGEWKEAREYFRNALREFERSAKTNIQLVDKDLPLARCHDDIASTSLELGDFPAATESYREALKIDRRRAEANPKNRDVQLDIWNDLVHLGDVAVKAGDDTAAAAWYEQAVSIVDQVERTEEFNTELDKVRRSLADCRARLSAPRPRELAPPPRPKPEK